MTIQRIAAVVAGILASKAVPTALRELERRLRFLCGKMPPSPDLLYSLEFLRNKAVIEVLNQDGNKESLRYQLSTVQSIPVIDLDVVRGFAANLLFLRDAQGMTVRELREQLTSCWSAVVFEEHLYRVVTELAHHSCVRKKLPPGDIEAWQFIVCPSFERCDHH